MKEVITRENDVNGVLLSYLRQEEEVRTVTGDAGAGEINISSGYNENINPQAEYEHFNIDKIYVFRNTD